MTPLFHFSTDVGVLHRQRRCPHADGRKIGGDTHGDARWFFIRAMRYDSAALLLEVPLAYAI